MSSPKRGSSEREATLLVVSEDPGRTFQRIGALRELAGYELKPRGRERIHDAYLDTPDGRLSAKRIALRTRDVGKKELVTLKGPSTHDNETGASRSELELPASTRSIALVRQTLEQMGVKWRGETTKSAEVADALGLVEVQRRITSRTIRDVVRMASPRNGVLAELALDRVTYQFDEEEARLFEIEIESKARAGGHAVKTIRRALLDRFPDDLLAWSFSKLATGKAMERAARSGRLGRWVDRESLLKPSAIPSLARALARD